MSIRPKYPKISNNFVSSEYTETEEQNSINYQFLKACKYGQIDNVIELLKQRVNVNVKDHHGMTPLHYVCEIGNEEIALILLKSGADINFKGEMCNRPPLHVACEKGYDGLVQMLLDRGAYINAKGGDQQRTTLHTACQEGLKNMATLLLDRGANINASDIDKTTPLHYACLEGHESVAQLLIARGADTLFMANDGMTPMDYCSITTRQRLNVSKLSSDKKGK